MNQGDVYKITYRKRESTFPATAICPFSINFCFIASRNQPTMADLEKMKSLVPGPLITLTASISGGHVQAALDPAVVKSCVRKCDLILLPMLAISYMLK